MRKHLLITAAVAALLGAGSLALAQVTTLPAVFSGNELVRLTTTAGQAGNVVFNHLRNSAGYLVTTATGTATAAPTNANEVLIINSAPTTLAITLPNPAYDGEIFTAANATASALTGNITVTAPAGGVQTQTLAVAYASATIAANGGRASWQFVATNATGSTGTWYRTE